MITENLLRGSLFLLGGLVGTLMAHEKIRPNADPEKAGRWLHKHARSMKILGPVVMAFGAAEIVLGLLGVRF